MDFPFFFFFKLMTLMDLLKDRKKGIKLIFLKVFYNYINKFALARVTPISP